MCSRLRFSECVSDLASFVQYVTVDKSYELVVANLKYHGFSSLSRLKMLNTE